MLVMQQSGASFACTVNHRCITRNLRTFAPRTYNSLVYGTAWWALCNALGVLNVMGAEVSTLAY